MTTRAGTAGSVGAPAATARGRRASRARTSRTPAAHRPVARVSVDVGLAHLDRPFDYLVPSEDDATVLAGSRVRVRFSGRLVDGLVLERAEHSEHADRLAFLDRAVSAEPVLTPELVRLARAVADRYAGTLSDVLRLAVPPRHARVEKEPAPQRRPALDPVDPSDRSDQLDSAGPRKPAGWSAYPTGTAFLAALARADAPRAAWLALPGEDWPTRIVEAVQATLAAGRGAVVVVPDARDADRVDAALTEALGPGRHVALAAGLGPAERYRRWLAVRRGAVHAVVGTRSAAFAPVADLGLAVLWDDGDDLHAEPRAPYPHMREVLLERTRLGTAGLLIGGFARTAEVQQLVSSGWLRPLVAGWAAVRVAAPRVAALGEDAEAARDPGARSARLPSLAWRTAREALARGAPVLVQVPRRGYVPALACGGCRSPARCAHCAGPLGRSEPGRDAVPTCRWCDRLAARWQCLLCGDLRLRAAIVGAGRTAEELGRAFPGTTVLTSGRDAVLAGVPPGPALVVCTPGAEPVAEGGYGAALLLDGWALLSRPDLRAGEETLRRWLAAAALVRRGVDGGQVVVMAAAGLRPVQAMVRWDPGWHAERELAERVELGFPPAVAMATLTGLPRAVQELAGLLEVPVQRIGPVPVDAQKQRLLLRVPCSSRRALAGGLAAAQAVRSARKSPDPVRVQIDPQDLL